MGTWGVQHRQRNHRLASRISRGKEDVVGRGLHDFCRYCQNWIELQSTQLVSTFTELVAWCVESLSARNDLCCDYMEGETESKFFAFVCLFCFFFLCEIRIQLQSFTYSYPVAHLLKTLHFPSWFDLGPAVIIQLMIDIWFTFDFQFHSIDPLSSTTLS